MHKQANNNNNNNNNNKEVNLIYLGSAKVIHELIHVNLSYFCTFDAVDAINICSTYKKM